MEKLQDHMLKVVRQSAESEVTNEGLTVTILYDKTSVAVANESKKLCIEFADYYMQQGFRSDRKPLETTEEYFNEFLEQYKF